MHCYSQHPPLRHEGKLGMDDKSCVMVPGIQAICTEWSATCIQIPLAYESISTRPFAKWAARGLCSNGSLTRWCSYFFWWLSGFLCGAVMFFLWLARFLWVVFSYTTAPPIQASDMALRMVPEGVKVNLTDFRSHLSVEEHNLLVRKLVAQFEVSVQSLPAEAARSMLLAASCA